MAAVEIRKNGGFPQPQGNKKPTQHFFYSPTLGEPSDGE